MYAGPDVYLHYRYSAILNQIWVAMTHGLALPMLFPICLFGIFNIYFVEKMLFAWFYKQPPLFDNKLNERALDILKLSPIVFLASAYWLLGNRQMFFNELATVNHKNDVPNPNHALFDFSNGFNGAVMVLFFWVLFLFSNLYDKLTLRISRILLGPFNYIQKLIKRRQVSTEKKRRKLNLDDFLDEDFQIKGTINENLDNYWATLPGID